MYGFSVLCCMSSALSEPGGLGLGTLGLPEPVARKMTAGPGFTRFMPRDFENPINAYCVRSDCPCPAQPNKALRSVAATVGRPLYVVSDPGCNADVCRRPSVEDWMRTTPLTRKVSLLNARKGPTNPFDRARFGGLPVCPKICALMGARLCRFSVMIGITG
jgi:hypothetical protein